jgi:hypothetical protein
VARRALAETLSAIDSAEPQEGPPAEALGRLVAAWWSNVSRHARVLDAIRSQDLPDEMHEFHAPVLERLRKLIRRGRRSGDFDRGPSEEWLAAAFLGLMHTAGDEVAAGRLDPDAARRELELTVPRLFGVAAAPR